MGKRQRESTGSEGQGGREKERERTQEKKGGQETEVHT